jgi:hypothetical protein
VFEFNLENFDLPDSEEHDIAAFVHQIDQGLAPAVHRAVLVSGADPDPAALSGYLMPQARRRNCDVVVIGRVDLGAGLQRLRWYWDRATNRFRADDQDLAPQTVAFFKAQAQAGTGSNLFLGVPVGMGRRFAVDPDNDLLFRADEAQFACDARDPDSDGDGFLDGTEVRFGSDPASAASLPSTAEVPTITSVRRMFHTARVAKLLVEADRPVRIQVDYSSNLGDVGQFTEEEYKTLWEVALRDLVPSNAAAGVHRIYSGTITVTDEFGHVDQSALAPFETLGFTDAMESGVPDPIEIECILRSLALVSATPAAGGGFDFVYQARVEDRKRASPAPLADHAVVVRVIRNGLVAGNVDVNGNPPAVDILSQFGFNGQYGGFGGAGPFVVGSISGADGLSTLTFRLPFAVSGDRVRISVEMAGRPVDVATFDPTLPYFSDSSLFDLANTPAAFRASNEITLP